MALPAIEGYTDEKLDDLLNAVLGEQERRKSRDMIPGQIADLRAKYLAADGDPAKLDEPAPA